MRPRSRASRRSRGPSGGVPRPARRPIAKTCRLFAERVFPCFLESGLVDFSSLTRRCREISPDDASVPAPPPPRRTGLQPTDLYGKFTWKIENFSEISKRELRSNVFEVGSYKWCVTNNGAGTAAPCWSARFGGRRPDGAPTREAEPLTPRLSPRPPFRTQVHLGVSSGMRRSQPPVALPLRRGLRQAPAR